jgi:polar amino acid transport system substrate-binding protein
MPVARFVFRAAPTRSTTKNWEDVMKWFAMCLIFLILNVGLASAAELAIVTEQSPPLNYTVGGDETGEVTGLSTEIVRAIMQKVGVDYPIRVMPWARGYDMAQSGPMVALYSTTRTEARENLFKWVGPLATKRWVFMARKGSGLSVRSLDEAKKVGTIGTYRDDAKEQFLKDQGFVNLDSASNLVANLKKLMAGRNDLWIVDVDEARALANQEGVDPSELEEVFSVREAHLYIAFSSDVPDELIASWQAAYDELKAAGVVDQITKKYLN